MKNEIEIESQRPRATHQVLRECRFYLRDLVVELDRKPLDRSAWKLPPAHARSGGYWFAPETSIPLHWSMQGDANSPTQSDGIGLSADIEEQENRVRVKLRTINAEHAAEMTEARLVGATTQIGLACVQLFRWDLHQRIIASLEDIPLGLRGSAGACVVHVRERQKSCVALQPAGSQTAIKVDVRDTDIAAAVIKEARDCSWNEAAGEIATFKELSGREVDLPSSRGIAEVMAFTDVRRATGDLPDLTEMRANDPTAALVKGKRKIEQGRKDRANRAGGWKSLGLAGPLQALAARVPSPLVEENPELGPIQWSDLGEFANAVRGVLSLSSAEVQVWAEWLRDNVKEQAVATLQASEYSPTR